jgi:hypothetical protein
MLTAIKDLISCKICKQITKGPVILPYGETICAEHEQLFRRNKETARCQICDKDHELGEAEHFPVNKAVQGFLAGEISKLDFGENYKNTKKLLEELDGAKAYYHKIRRDPEDLIFDKFQAMRRKVDLIREQIIQRVTNAVSR